jgi:hypothetical protein
MLLQASSHPGSFAIHVLLGLKQLDDGKAKKSLKF